MKRKKLQLKKQTIATLSKKEMIELLGGELNCSREEDGCIPMKNGGTIWQTLPNSGSPTC